MISIDVYRDTQPPLRTEERHYEHMSVRETFEPITTTPDATVADQVELMLPGFGAVWARAQQRLQGLGQLNPGFRPPSIILCPKNDLDQFIAAATVGSESPHQGIRGLGHYESVGNAFYFSIEDIYTRLGTPDGREHIERMIIEETLHALTTVRTPTTIRTGFLATNILPDAHPIPLGVYRWHIDQLPHQPDKVPPYPPAPGNRTHEAATEHLTALIINLLFPKPDSLYFKNRHPRGKGLPALFIIKETLETFYGYASGGGALAPTCFTLLLDGNIELLYPTLIQPFEVWQSSVAEQIQVATTMRRAERPVPLPKLRQYRDTIDAILKGFRMLTSPDLLIFDVPSPKR